MIGNIVTDPETGIPLDNNGNKVSPSAYQPPTELMKLFTRCQTDYGLAWQLQHRPFDEFDGVSLLQRANLDQQTFGAFVGAEYIPQNKKWRWRGRKNTSRNKIIGVLAQIISGILIPTVYATDDQQNESRECAKCMRILVQEHLRRSDYGVKFIFMVLSALVNPATFVQVEYVQKMQAVKLQLENGETKVEQAVDELLSGLMLNVVPIDELMLGDFFTFNMQAQPFLIRLRRIPYDVARGIYAGRYFDQEGKDMFDHVQAGMTHIFAGTQENQTLYDIEWSEGDRGMVQVATFSYRGEDFEIDWVGGIFMGNYDYNNPDKVYSLNPFKHRRMTQVGDGWGSMPVYGYAKGGYEPLDPQMRFAYYKSAAFKEFWDDATLNMAERLLVDGMHLDVMKPILISGISKYDSSVMAPGAVAALPKDALVSPYQLGPNLAAAMQVLEKQNKDLEDSTTTDLMRGQLGPVQTAEATRNAIQQAKRMFSVSGGIIAQFVEDIGELTIDCIITNTTVGEVNESLPGALGMKFQTLLARGKDKGKDVTHKIVMTDRYMGRVMTDKQKKDRAWQLWDEGGGNDKNATKIWEINPYQFARRNYSCYIDVEEMILRSTGADRSLKDRALAVLTSPAVAPFTDPQAVVNDFAIEEYGGNDPDRYKRKGTPDAMMQMMGMQNPAADGTGKVDAGKQAGLPVLQ